MCVPMVGDWEGKEVPQRVVDAAPVFRVGKGVVVLQLNSTASDHPGVHHVEVMLSSRTELAFLQLLQFLPEDQGGGYFLFSSSSHMYV